MVYFGRMVTDIDTQTFVSLGDCYYAKDKHNVYYSNRPIKDADISTITCLWPTTAKDKNSVYEKGLLKPNLDANSFKYFNAYYAKDKNNVYADYYYAEWYRKIPNADTVTFQALNEEYAQDKYNLYCESHVVPFVDRDTFEVIGRVKAKDKNYIYEWCAIIECLRIDETGCTQKKRDSQLTLLE